MMEIGNAWSSFFLTVTILLTGEYYKFYHFALRHPSIIYNLIVLGLTSAIGQIFLFSMVSINHTYFTENLSLMKISSRIIQLWLFSKSNYLQTLFKNVLIKYHPPVSNQFSNSNFIILILFHEYQERHLRDPVYCTNLVSLLIQINIYYFLFIGI